MQDDTAPERQRRLAHGAGEPPFSELERIKHALAVAGVGVFEWDVNSDLVTWSSATTGLGLSIAEAPTTGCAFFACVHPDDRPAVGEHSERALRDRTDAEMEFRVVDPRGVVHWVHAHSRVQFDPDGKPLRFLGVNVEITQRMALQARLRSADAQVTRLKVLRATMRTVQDIVSNALMSLQMLRFSVEQHAAPELLDQFDHVVSDTAARLRALGDVEDVVETDMVMGAGIHFQADHDDPQRRQKS